MHKQVDAILAKSQQTLNQMKTAGLTKLQDQEKYLRDRLQQLKRDVQRYEDQLQHGDPNALIQFEPDAGQSKVETKPPSLEIASVPVFTEGQNDSNVIEKMFGRLSIKAAPQNKRSVPPKFSSDPSSYIAGVEHDQALMRMLLDRDSERWRPPCD